MTLSPSPSVYEERIKKILLSHLGGRNCKVILFGSRAHDPTGSERSDFDIGVLPLENLTRELTLLREELDESTIPFKVDLVDLGQTSETFRDKVLKEGVVWKE